MSSRKTPESSRSIGIFRIFNRSVKELGQLTKADIDARKVKKPEPNDIAKKPVKREDLKNEFAKGLLEECGGISGNHLEDSKPFSETKISPENESKYEMDSVHKLNTTIASEKIAEVTVKTEKNNKTDIKGGSKTKSKMSETNEKNKYESIGNVDHKSKGGAGKLNVKVTAERKKMRKHLKERQYSNGRRRATGILQDKFTDCQKQRSENVNINRHIDRQEKYQRQHNDPFSVMEDWSSEFVDIEKRNDKEKNTTVKTDIPSVPVTRPYISVTKIEAKEEITVKSTAKMSDTLQDTGHNSDQLYKEKETDNGGQLKQSNVQEDWTDELVPTRQNSVDVYFDVHDEENADLTIDTVGTNTAINLRESVLKTRIETKPFQSTPKKNLQYTENRAKINFAKQIEECFNDNDFKFDDPSETDFIQNGKTQIESAVVKKNSIDCNSGGEKLISEIETDFASNEGSVKIDLKDGAIAYIGNIPKSNENFVSELELGDNFKNENLKNLFKNVHSGYYTPNINETCEGNCNSTSSKANKLETDVRKDDRYLEKTDNNCEIKVDEERRCVNQNDCRATGWRNEHVRHKNNLEKRMKMQELICKENEEMSNDFRSSSLEADHVPCEEYFIARPSKGRGTVIRQINRDLLPRFQKAIMEQNERASRIKNRGPNHSSHKDGEKFHTQNPGSKISSCESKQWNSNANGPSNGHVSTHGVGDSLHRNRNSNYFKSRAVVTTEHCDDVKCSESEHLKNNSTQNRKQTLNRDEALCPRISPLMDRCINTPEKYKTNPYPTMPFHRTTNTQNKYESEWILPTSEVWDTDSANQAGKPKSGVKNKCLEKKFSISANDKTLPYTPPTPGEDVTESESLPGAWSPVESESREIGNNRNLAVPYLPPPPDETVELDEDEDEVTVETDDVNTMNNGYKKHVEITEHIEKEFKNECFNQQSYNKEVKYIEIDGTEEPYIPPPPDEASFEMDPESIGEGNSLLSGLHHDGKVANCIGIHKHDYVNKESEKSVRSFAEPNKMKHEHVLLVGKDEMEMSTIPDKDKRDLITIIEASESDYAGSTTDASHSDSKIATVEKKFWSTSEKFHSSALTPSLQDDIACLENQYNDTNGTSQEELSDLPIDDSAVVDVGASDTTSTDYGYVPPVVMKNNNKHKYQTDKKSRNYECEFQNGDAYSKYWYEQQRQAYMRPYPGPAPWFPYYYGSDAYRDWYYQIMHDEKMRQSWEKYWNQYETMHVINSSNKPCQNVSFKHEMEFSDSSNSLGKQGPSKLNIHSQGESKLSDYWTERMPYWVVNQNPGAQLQDDSIGESCVIHKDHVSGDITKSAIAACNEGIRKLDITGTVSESKQSVYQSHSTKRKEISENINGDLNAKLENVSVDDKQTESVANESEKVKTELVSGFGKSTNYRPHQPKATSTPCSCRRDHIQYLIWRMCKCSAGKPPRLHKILPGHQYERSLDLGYLSYDSLEHDESVLLTRHRTSLTDKSRFSSSPTTVPSSSFSQLKEGDPALTHSVKNDVGTSLHHAGMRPPPGFKPVYTLNGHMSGSDQPVMKDSETMADSKIPSSRIDHTRESQAPNLTHQTLKETRCLSDMVTNNNRVIAHDIRNVDGSLTYPGKGDNHNFLINAVDSADVHVKKTMCAKKDTLLSEAVDKMNRAKNNFDKIDTKCSGDVNNNRSSDGKIPLKHEMEQNSKAKSLKETLEPIKSYKELEEAQTRTNTNENRELKPSINYSELPKCLGKSASHLVEVSAGLDRADITQENLTSTLHLISKAIMTIEARLQEHPDVNKAEQGDGTHIDNVKEVLDKQSIENAASTIVKRNEKECNKNAEIKDKFSFETIKSISKTMTDHSRNQKQDESAQIDNKEKTILDKKRLFEEIKIAESSSNISSTSGDCFSESSADERLQAHVRSQSPEIERNELEEEEIPENEFLDVPDFNTAQGVPECEKKNWVKTNSELYSRTSYMQPRYGPLYRSPLSSLSSGESATRLQRAVQNSLPLQHPRIQAPYRYSSLSPWCLNTPQSFQYHAELQTDAFHQGPKIPSLLQNWTPRPPAWTVSKEVNATATKSMMTEEMWTPPSSSDVKVVIRAPDTKLKLVEYESSEDSSDGSDIKPFVSSSFSNNKDRLDTSSNVAQKLRIEQPSKKFKADCMENSSNSPANLIDEKNQSNCGVSFKISKRPARRLSQTTLKSFTSEEWQPSKTETHLNLKQLKEKDSHNLTRKTLTEVLKENLKGSASSITKNKVDREVDDDESDVIEVHHSLLRDFPPIGETARQNVPPLPPLPPFPMSPFWGMYLTNSDSALKGPSPKEQFYEANSTTVVKKYQNSTPSSYRKFGGKSRWSPGFSPSETDSESYSQRSDWKHNFKQFHSFGVKYIDTHCHLDFLFNRAGYRGNLKSYMDDHPETFPDTFEGCVAVFCNPSTFTPYGGLWMEVAKEDNVWIAMGCHPKMAQDFTPAAEAGLRKCLHHNKCVALGEIGLDYSGTFWQHEEVQKRVLRKQLEIAITMDKPLVIHCRDAEEDCLSILKEVVPKNHKIHCHCFTAYYANAKLWTDAFPNLYIGVTPLVTYRTATPTHDLARNIPLNRLLLETDAPYFIPRCIPRDDLPLSNPGLAVTVAKEIAQYQELPVAAVLRQARLNTKFMYGI